jgi:hypothetical protein
MLEWSLKMVVGRKHGTTMLESRDLERYKNSRNNKCWVVGNLYQNAIMMKIEKW